MVKQRRTSKMALMESVKANIHDLRAHATLFETIAARQGTPQAKPEDAKMMLDILNQNVRNAAWALNAWEEAMS